MEFCARSTGLAPPRRIYWTMCASSWPRPAAAASATFARLSSWCTLVDGARNRARRPPLNARSNVPRNPCTTLPTKCTGTNRKRARTPATASSSARRCPTTASWRPRACRSIAASGFAACRICRWRLGSGSYIQLFGTEGLWGLYLVEIPSAGALNVERHLYEKVVLVVEGRGTTEVWQEGQGKRHVFEWQKGSLFSIPLNAYHRLVNAASAPALLLCGTSAPNVMNVIDNTDFLFNCPYTFSERFAGAEDYFNPRDDIEPDPIRGLAMRRTNLIPDIVNTALPLDNRRSPGYRRVEPFMAANRFYLWIGQHETGRYSKAHKHASAAVLVCIKGKGYTYTWPEALGTTPWRDGKADKVLRQDYEPVGLVSAAPMSGDWFHQHFGV